MRAYVVAIEGVKALEQLDQLDEKARLAAVRAINKTAAYARTLASRTMQQQVNFKASYLTERLTVSRKASGRDLEAVITGRARPTSLARFVTGNSKGRGVRVMVKPGVARYISRAFLMPLRSGESELGNVGLAVRTDGQKPPGAYKPKRISDNLYLLYGPSVDQVFRSVRDEIGPDVSEYLAAEFSRLMALEID